MHIPEEPKNTPVNIPFQSEKHLPEVLLPCIFRVTCGHCEKRDPVVIIFIHKAVGNYVFRLKVFSDHGLRHKNKTNKNPSMKRNQNESILIK